AIEADRREHDTVLQIEPEKLPALRTAAEHETIPGRGMPYVLDDVLVLIGPERMHVIVGLVRAEHRLRHVRALAVGLVPVLHSQTAKDRMEVGRHVSRPLD